MINARKNIKVTTVKETFLNEKGEVCTTTVVKTEETPIAKERLDLHYKK